MMLKLIRIGFLTLVGMLTIDLVAATLMEVSAKPVDAANKVQKFAPYLRPLKFPDGDNYCSSSSISYKGKVFTLTNNHCCEVVEGMFGKGEVRVGRHIEKIIHQSKMHDVCVLTSQQIYTPIKLAKEPAKMLGPVTMIGWPRGQFLVPRFGYIVAKDVRTCVGHRDGGVDCRPSTLGSTLIYGGNSGSPVFNSNWEVVNLAYAGNMFIHTYAIYVPYVYVRAALEEAWLKQARLPLQRY